MANPNEIRVYLLGFSESQNPAGTKRLLTLLRSAGIRTEASDWILKGHTINPLPFVSRAHEFSKALVWKADWILDVTGGDGANAVLDLLDYEGYQNSDSILAGYSDVSCVLNALACLRLPAMKMKKSCWLCWKRNPTGWPVPWMKTGIPFMEMIRLSMAATSAAF